MEQGAVRRLQQQAGRHYGKYRGTVTANDDPRQLGRIRARVPEVLGEVETGWALPCVPYAGDGSGFFAVPPMDAGVWIEFEAGDVSRPVWTGCWWAEGALPPDQTGRRPDAEVKILRSEAGLMVVLDDDGRTITLSDANGVNLLSIQSEQGAIRVQAAAGVEILAPSVALGKGASHPVVLGDQLISYLGQLVASFNTHLHPGQTVGPGGAVIPAPPVPPLTPPSPGLVTSRIKTSG